MSITLVPDECSRLHYGHSYRVFVKLKKLLFAEDAVCALLYISFRNI